MHPAQGFGCPSDTHLYYCHPDYIDYTNNPAIKLEDNWSSDEGSGNRHLFSVLIPEGGFAITAHGAGINEILDALEIDYSYVGTDDDLLRSLVNNPELLADSLRISYDVVNKTITFSK